MVRYDFLPLNTWFPVGFQWFPHGFHAALSTNSMVSWWFPYGFHWFLQQLSFQRFVKKLSVRRRAGARKDEQKDGRIRTEHGVIGLDRRRGGRTDGRPYGRPDRRMDGQGERFMERWVDLWTGTDMGWKRLTGWRTDGRKFFFVVETHSQLSASGI